MLESIITFSNNAHTAGAGRLFVHSDIYATSCGARLTYPKPASNEEFLPDLAPTATGAFLSSRKRTVTFVSLATGYPSPASVSPCSEALCFSMAEAFSSED